MPLHNHPNRLISFETANMNPAGTVDFYIGTSQTDRRGSGGTGNQRYFGRGSYSPSDKLTFGIDVQTYQDPVANPINGAYPDMKMRIGALWGRYQLYKTDSVSVATLVSIENIFALDSQLFGGRSENILFGSLKTPITYTASPEWQVHLTPSVTVMPDTVKGTQFYGTFASIGAGFSCKPSQRLTFLVPWKHRSTGPTISRARLRSLNRRSGLRERATT